MISLSHNIGENLPCTRIYVVVETNGSEYSVLCRFTAFVFRVFCDDDWIQNVAIIYFLIGQGEWEGMRGGGARFCLWQCF